VLFINQRYVNWGLEGKVKGFGYIQEDFVQVIENDYDFTKILTCLDSVMFNKEII
jgi:hypothetical protein